MSTLNEMQRLALIVIYDLWLLVGFSVCFLYTPVLIRRASYLGHNKFFKDATGMMLFALVLLVASTTMARFYFLVQMRWVNQGRFDDVFRWINMYGWVPVAAQALCVVALIIFVQIYFFHKDLTFGLRRNAIHLIVGWSLVGVLFIIESTLWKAG